MENVKRFLVRYSFVVIPAIYVVATVLMDIAMYLFMGLRFPSRYYFSLIVLLAICGLMFFIKKPSVQYGICIFLLSVHFAAAVANIILFHTSKEIVSLETLTAARQVATLADFIILDFGYMLTFSFIVLAFISAGIWIFSLIGKNRRRFSGADSNKYRRNVGFALATLALTAYLAGIFNMMLPKVSLDMSQAYENYTNDRFAYATFSNRSRVLQEFGTYSYYWSNIAFLIGLKQEFIYNVPDEIIDNFTFRALDADKQNVIMVQMETLEDSLVNQWVMPNLYGFLHAEKKTASKTVKFEGLYAVDRTSIAEYSALAGVHLDDVEMNTMPMTKSPFALPQILARSGNYDSIKAFHNFYDYMYNRSSLFENGLGFDEYIALLSNPQRSSDMINDLAVYGDVPSRPEEETRYSNTFNQNSDLKMFQSQKEKMAPEDGNFFSWILNISTHAPYYDANLFDFYKESGVAIQNEDTMKELKKIYGNLNSADKSTREAVVSCLTAAHEYDRGLGVLLKHLDEGGLLDKTTIVFYADHYNYVNPDLLAPTKAAVTETYPLLCGAQGRQLAFYIYSPAFEGEFEAGPHVVRKFLNHFDIYATICDILHIENNTKYTLGVSAFSQQENVGFSVKTGLIFSDKWAADSFFEFLPGSIVPTPAEVIAAKTRLSHSLAVMNNLRPLFRADSFPEQAYYSLHRT